MRSRRTLPPSSGGSASTRGPEMARKPRGRGEGGIWRRAGGQWCASVSLGYTAAGKRNRKVLYGATKAEVQEKLKEYDPTRPPADGALTFGRFLGSWLERV